MGYHLSEDLPVIIVTCEKVTLMNKLGLMIRLVIKKIIN